MIDLGTITYNFGPCKIVKICICIMQSETSSTMTLLVRTYTLFEKMFLLQALAETDYKNKINSCNMQLNLYES